MFIEKEPETTGQIARDYPFGSSRVSQIRTATEKRLKKILVRNHDAHELLAS